MIKLNINKIILITCAILMSSCGRSEKSEPWINLFDGTSLNGWNVQNTNQNFKVYENTIMGTNVMNKVSYLTSHENFSDFILEFDYKVDEGSNIDILIRGKSRKGWNNYLIDGYLIPVGPSINQIDSSYLENITKSNIYTSPIQDAALKKFKPSSWNHFRIEVIGDSIKTWLNDIPSSFIIDKNYSRGLIGLQNNQLSGAKSSYKNIKIVTENVSKYSRKINIEPQYTENVLTKYEVDTGWELLWNGKNFEGWRGAKLEHFPKNGWQIENGELSVLKSGGEESVAGGDIVTRKMYADFELKVDFKITKGANSGIKYYVDTNINKGKGSSIGLEFQILDDQIHPDAKKGNHEGSRTIGSLYDLIQADTTKFVKPVGEWNSAYIKSKNNHVEHWLNGIKIVEYEKGSLNFRKLVSESKYSIWPNFGELIKGNILLQDHGDKVSFRNLKIKEL